MLHVFSVGLSLNQMVVNQLYHMLYELITHAFSTMSPTHTQSIELSHS